MLFRSGLKEKLELYNKTFHQDDRSLKKAVWMLLVDAIDSLLECHDFLLNKRHKIAGRLFRDAVEVIDLSMLFMTKTEKSKRLLDKWYDDEVIPNREYRNYVDKNLGPYVAEKYRKFYSQISKINHRTYKALTLGYILDVNGTFVYDEFTSHLKDTNFLVYPGIISMYYAILANVVFILSLATGKSELVSNDDIGNIWENSIENIPEKRKY